MRIRQAGVRVDCVGATGSINTGTLVFWVAADTARFMRSISGLRGFGRVVGGLSLQVKCKKYARMKM